MGEHADLSDVVGVYDGDRVGRVGFGAGLVTKDAKRQHRGGDRTVFGDDLCHLPTVRGQVVGVEFAGVHGLRAGRREFGDLLVEVIGPTRGEHRRGAVGQPPGELDADLAATSQNKNWTCARVVHGCDYYLR